MPFERRSLKPLAGVSRSQQPRLYAYFTDDNDAAVEAAGYFDSLAEPFIAEGAVQTNRNILQAGDLIFAHTDVSGTPEHHIYRVATSNDTAITIADGATL